MTKFFFFLFGANILYERLTHNTHTAIGPIHKIFSPVLAAAFCKFPIKEQEFNVMYKKATEHPL